MARATRSAAQHEKDKPAESAPAAKKAGSKKRKRVSNAADSEPAAKQARTDIKEEIAEADEHLTETKDGEVSSTGDMPILSSDAEEILDVLEVVDTQGLLDRVFPLSTKSLDVDLTGSEASSSTSTQTYSLRTLLKDSSQYSLRVLRSAVQHLFPIFSHQRSRPSETVEQQLQFCNLALSLLDQASTHISPVPLNAETLRPPSPDPEADSKEVSEAPPPVGRRKYALVQHLPSGDWWSSLNSELATVADEEKGLPELSTANAELVAILPSASTSTSTQTITLGAYAVKKPPGFKPPGPRQLSCGRFLDYGPYASFAPYFDQEGAEVGRDALGEVVWQLEQKRRRERAKGKQRALPTPSYVQTDAAQDDDVVEIQPPENAQAEQKEASKQADVVSALDGLLLPEDVAAIKAGLSTLELENAVQELLDRNVRALRRLEELQLERLGQAEGGASIVEVGSEEWDVAQGILDSLSLLASFRPRASSSGSASLVPPASVLHKLQRTLPVEATQGWYGTLPDVRATALRDDTTVKVKSGVVAAPAIPAVPVAPVVTTTPKPATTAAAYNPYTYNSYSTQYARGYGAYTPGQASTYYPSYPSTAGQASAHYPSTQYGTTGHHQYSGYSGWYNYQPQSQPIATTAASSTSGRATPQAGTAATPVANTYAGFFASASQPQAQRAVANTVLSAAAGKTYQSGTWAAGQPAGYVPPTLPPHLRGTVGATSTPGTSQPVTPGGTTTYGYYGNYQATSSTAR